MFIEELYSLEVSPFNLNLKCQLKIKKYIFDMHSLTSLVWFVDSLYLHLDLLSLSQLQKWASVASEYSLYELELYLFADIEYSVATWTILFLIKPH